jgi:hypothetical protein
MGDRSGPTSSPGASGRAASPESIREQRPGDQFLTHRASRTGMFDPVRSIPCICLAPVLLEVSSFRTGRSTPADLPASPLSQQGSSHEHGTRGNVRRWRLVSAERGLWSLSGLRLQRNCHDHGGNAAGPCRFNARLQHVNYSSQSTGPIFPAGAAFVSSFRGGRQCERSVARS